MGWKAYNAQLAEPHDFSEFGCPDFKVDLRRIDSFPYGEVKSYTAQAAELGVDEKTTLADVAVINDAVLVKCVTRWNIPHPETGEVLPLPSEDPTSLDVLPSEFVAQLHIWLQEDSQLAKMAPAGGAPVGKLGKPTSPPRQSRRKIKAASRKTKS